MLTAIVRAAVARPVVVLMGAMLLFAAGVSTLLDARYDVFPDFVPPQATVQTEAPGFTPEQVEVLVTRPLEQAVLGANGVASVRSESIQGLSVISVTFDERIDPVRARQIAAEQVAQVSSTLPSTVASPQLSPLTSSTMDLLKVGFVSSRVDPASLRAFVEWTVKPSLLSVPGVARATVFGGDSARIEVRLRWEELFARGISVEDIASALRTSIELRGGGFIDTATQRILVEPRLTTLTAANVGEIVIATDGEPAPRIADVAEVVETGAPRFGDALIQGKRGVLLTLSGQYGANTLEVTRAVEHALAEFDTALAQSGIELYPALHRPANFIETALSGIRTDLLLGAGLIAFVLYGFVRDVRVALISFTSIPLSLMAAVIVLDRMGTSMDTMTLGGLAVALGVVIDDAIVDVENITRRLGRWTPTASESLASVLVAACVEVRKPIVAATGVLSLSVVPVLALHGLQGAFFGPLALAFLLAIVASLAVALTVTPALATLLLRGHDPRPEPTFLRLLKRAHRRLLTPLLRRPRAVLACVGAVGLATVALFSSFGAELLPAFRERHYVLQVNGPAGASFQTMEVVGASITEQLLAVDGITTVEQQLGRAEAGEDTWPPNRSEFHVELARVDGAAEERILRRIREVLAGYPGFQTEALTFLGDRIGESLTGETSALAIGVFGSDLDVDDRVADQIAGALRDAGDAADVQVKMQPGAPVTRIELDPSLLALERVSAGAVFDAIAAVNQGLRVAQLARPDRVTDVVIARDGSALAPEQIGDVRLRTADGAWIRVQDVARVDLVSGRTSIGHDGGRRRQMVTANSSTRDVAGFVSRARERIARVVEVPAGVHLEFGGTAQTQAAAVREIAWNVGGAFVAILVLLSVAFGGWRAGAIVLSSVPFAAAGGVLAVVATGGVVSLGVLVGLITLFGITARNGILLVSHVDHLVRAEGRSWTAETILDATEERLRPILMTALVAALALIPLALQSGEAGREVQGPMAQVILGGLGTSLVMSLFLLPALVLAYRWPHNSSLPSRSAPSQPLVVGESVEGPAD